MSSPKDDEAGGFADKCANNEVYFRCIGCSSAESYDILSKCLHVVCKQCLSSLKSDELYKCPSCGEFSSETINNPTISKSEVGQNTPKCNWCDDNGEDTKSVGNCKECDVWLCDECLKGHNRMPPLRNHSIVMLSKSVNQDNLRCEAHPHETLECFCEACGILTCRDCQLSVHRDHGSHRWVGEKASLLKAPLEEAVAKLEQYQPQLLDSASVALNASTSTKDDSFLGSVEKTRLGIEARASSLILRIRSRTDALLKELDKKCDDSVQQLVAAEALIQKLQQQIQFTLTFANRLISNKDAHPASLVQLFDVVRNRLECLRSRAERLIMDLPPSADALEAANCPTDSSDLSAWRKSTLGWRTTANTRALFFGNWNPEELARHSGQVAWLPKPAAERDQKTPCSTNMSVKPEGDAGMFGTDDNAKTNGADKPDNINSFSHGTSFGDFLDNLAELDDRNRGTPTQPSMGCAICFGGGLLAHCRQCRRTYHLDCHLPRLTSVSLVPGWVCGLCADQSAATVASVDPVVPGGMSQTDYLTGCRILMGLLVHAEAVHFCATVCPACSVPLLQPGLAVKHCPAGHLYHRLADLRLQLEQAALGPNDSFPDMLHENVDVNGKVDIDNLSASGRARLTRLDDWLVAVDKFWSDAANEDDPSNAHITSKGCLRAARRLRSRLTSLVRVHRPESLAALSALCPDNLSDDAGSTTLNDDTDRVIGSCGTAEFRIGAD
ncbi:E3 ubiquitin-protein ligase TRIM33 [Fasciola hepatica]|uniref:E3 ubiquitin-protein ligase TRIM33 n=1 Tax=Fasciola hepatica TaxID=6192 RepID=A0A4E0S2G8_FASHE|nr:E3 ubiquitin-protein ligase TRIM33 [Fasciola hepatica]